MGTTGTPPPRKVLKRACDGCKIRKIKCSEVAPCNGCVAVGIECTFKKRQDRRGPRSLRAKTIQIIAQTQSRGDAADQDGDIPVSSPVGKEQSIPRSPLVEEQFGSGNSGSRTR